MGYSEVQIKDLQDTIQRSVCDAVVIATPTDLGRRIRIDQPTVRVKYDFNVHLLPMIDRFIEKRVISQSQQRERGRR
jgi:predicted GTPase